ncbi:MAG: hypothetical protein IJG42_00890 [Muribaculaceae bacterium]|nr:hypothetical protein [Muribaculaceae bacterium]
MITMKATKKLMSLLLAMLALTGCKESKDEPTPDGKVDGEVYVLVGSHDRDFVYNLDGDVIYSSPEGSHIASLQAEGGDWYALVKYDNQSNEIIKNGKYVMSTTHEITEFGVGNGKIFTLQRVKLGDDTYQWGFGEDNKPLIQLSEDKFYSYRNLMVYSEGSELLYTGQSYYFFLEFNEENGSRMLGKYYNYETTTIDPIDLVYGYVTSCDFTPGGFIYCYEDWDTNKNIYSWNDEKRELGFIPTQVRVFDRKPYVLGSKATKQTGSGATREPVVVIDGEETILRTDFLPKDLVNGVKMLQHGDDVYILATGNNYSCIFKNLEPIEVNAGIPNPWYLTDMISLSNNEYKDFVVVDRPIEK